MTSSTEIHTGDIGEALCHYRLLEMGVPCRIVNLGATDIIAIIDDEIVVRIQVKTAHRSYDPRYPKRKPNYAFNICRGSKVKRRFNDNDIDIIACVGIEDGAILFYPAKQLVHKKRHRIMAHLYEDYRVTKDTWEKAIRPLLYA